jgi:ankyrin repeat protein
VDKCLNALFITDPADDVEMIEHTKGRLFQGSGSWLHANSAFNEWLTCKRSRVLWLNGDPGRGKTMLAISVLKSISERIKASSSGPNVLLAYFFCDNKDKRRNNSIAVLRGLIYQLLHARPDLSSQFRALFSKEGDQLFNSPTALHSLWRTLKDFFSSPSIHRVYIVIDGLDELDEESVDDMLKLLGPFLDFEQCSLEDRPRPDQTDSCQVKWFLTSRNVRSISGTLCQTLNISLEENSDHVQDAVSKFIDMRVNQLREEKGYNSNLTSLVANTLREKSEGTFLYVSMACGALSRPNVRLFDTDKVLRTFPKGLEPLYERMIKQIHTAADEDHVQYTKAILRAMVLAVRPLSLQELAIMAGLPEEHHVDLNMLQEYVSLCGSFVTLRQDKVYFVHESVKAYLMSIDKIFSRPFPQYHADLARLLITIIIDPREAVSSGDEKSSSLTYPRLFWMDHARQAEDHINWTDYLSSKLFRWSQKPRVKWLDFYWHAHHADWDKQPENFCPLHLAAYGGIGSLVKALVARGDPINERDSNGCTPLMWAAKNGYPDVVELLLELGADYETRTPGDLTAVFWASINGHYRSLEKLIQGGAPVLASDKLGRTPLHYAAAYGNIKTLGVLLLAGADVDAKDIGRHTALQRASSQAELAIVSALIKHNADTGVKDKEGRTLLHLAARGNDLNVLDFWLKNSNDDNTVDDHSWTPLMHAVTFGIEKATLRLINHGVQIEARTREGHTALSLATLNGRVEGVKALLNGGADPNTSCQMNETPLQQAAWLGHVAICQLLLEAGANANTTSNASLTPLHQAAANGHEVAAKLLLRYGADPNAVCSIGQTPGARAEENKHYTLAKYLRNREISGQDDDSAVPEAKQRKPLDLAVCELLKISPECGFVETHGKEGFSRPDKVTALINGKATYYFMKSGPNGDMFSCECLGLFILDEQANIFTI